MAEEPIRWGPRLPLPADPGQEREHGRAACRRALAEAYASFAFDKFCYQLSSLGSRGLAEQHRCGNCYSFAAYTQRILRDKHGIRSHVIVGNVPKYFMRDAYQGICHAALYVPSAACILDPSVYAPPLPLPGESVPTEGTIMRSFATRIRTSFLGNGGGGAYSVSNPLTGKNSVGVPAGTPLVKVLLLRGNRGVSEYEYVLRGVTNFDQSITRAVHGINNSLFRTSTDSGGRFLFKAELKDDDSVQLTDYRDKTLYSRQPSGEWTPSNPPTDADMRRFLRPMLASYR